MKMRLVVSIILIIVFVMCQTPSFAASYYDHVWDYDYIDENFYRRIALDPYPDGVVPNFPVTGHMVDSPMDINPEHKIGMFFYVDDVSKMQQVLDTIIRRTKIRLTE